MNQQEFRILEQINSNLEKLTSAVKAMSETMHKDNTVTTTNSTTFKIAANLDKINDTMQKGSKILEEGLKGIHSSLNDIASKVDNK